MADKIEHVTRWGDDVYRCVNKRCRDVDKEVLKGRPNFGYTKCIRCGQHVVFVRHGKNLGDGPKFGGSPDLTTEMVGC